MPCKDQWKPAKIGFKDNQLIILLGTFVSYCFWKRIEFTSFRLVTCLDPENTSHNLQDDIKIKIQEAVTEWESGGKQFGVG